MCTRPRSCKCHICCTDTYWPESKHAKTASSEVQANQTCTLLSTLGKPDANQQAQGFPTTQSKSKTQSHERKDEKTWNPAPQHMRKPETDNGFSENGREYRSAEKVLCMACQKDILEFQGWRDMLKSLQRGRILFKVNHTMYRGGIIKILRKLNLELIQVIGELWLN